MILFKKHQAKETLCKVNVSGAITTSSGEKDILLRLVWNRWLKQVRGHEWCQSLVHCLTGDIVILSKWDYMCTWPCSASYLKTTKASLESGEC